MNRTDPEIRAALLPAIRAAHPDALVVQEWGIGYQLFADVAAVGVDSVCAWEIKSAADSTARLARQVPLYSAAFDRCTVVAAPRHLARVRALVPAWWGVTVAAEAEIWTERDPKPNPGAVNSARLLWATEAYPIAHRFNLIDAAHELQRAEFERWYPTGRYRKPSRPRRAHLDAVLAGIPRETLTPLVCAALRARKDWRREDGYRRSRAA